MAELTPVPLDILATRLFRELEQKNAAFDLPARHFYSGDDAGDLSLSIHGHRASTPFGPAAGPHTQLAQNIVLAWLCGGRFMELKTVQIKDDLVIPRPCIDMQTVGFNVEWSQELKIAQSIEEYVKASMLIEMLKAAGYAQGHADTVFDMSVGYDLAGISSPPMREFLGKLKDASSVVARLRGQIPAHLSRFHDLAYPTRLSDTLTLSTFHGCPPDEIEAIAAFLLEEIGLNVVVKLNPTLLGRERLAEILHGRLGYTELSVPDAAFDKDANWDQVRGFVQRLGDKAQRLGRGFGVKFSNTLLVRNHKAFFPSTEKEMYLSGAPLHVLAMSLVAQFRAEFGDRYPVSFSAGIDSKNFADAVAVGLKPVTVCSDLLKAGGYTRGARYLSALRTRMESVGARDIEQFILRAYGQGEAALTDLDLPAGQKEACARALSEGGDARAAAGDAFPAWVSATVLRNTTCYVERLLGEARYARAQNKTPPRKVGSTLVLFDCLTCDKCIPVCPNDANFTFVAPTGVTPVERLVRGTDGWSVESLDTLAIDKAHQIANFADACNECGNCDVFCPEDGGPHLAKPRLFGSVAAWQATPGRDGFAIEAPTGDLLRVHGRFGGTELLMEKSGQGKWRYCGKGFDVRLDLADPVRSIEGTAEVPVDLKWLRIMDIVSAGVLAQDNVNFVSAGLKVVTEDAA